MRERPSHPPVIGEIGIRSGLLFPFLEDPPQKKVWCRGDATFLRFLPLKNWFRIPIGKNITSKYEGRTEENSDILFSMNNIHNGSFKLYFSWSKNRETNFSTLFVTSSLPGPAAICSQLICISIWAPREG